MGAMTTKKQGFSGLQLKYRITLIAFSVQPFVMQVGVNKHTPVFWKTILENQAPAHGPSMSY